MKHGTFAADSAHRTGDTGPAVKRSRQDGRRRAASFLLRLWAEPREARGARPRLGVFASRLGTEEQHYFSDLTAFVAWLRESAQRDLGVALEPAGPDVPKEDAGPAGEAATPRGDGGASR